MKLTSFTEFQGSLADEFPGILTISRQEFSHFLCFDEYIPTSIDRQNTMYMTQSIAIPRMILYNLGLPKYVTCILISLPAIATLNYTGKTGTRLHLQD